MINYNTCCWVKVINGNFYCELMWTEGDQKPRSNLPALFSIYDPMPRSHISRKVPTPDRKFFNILKDQTKTLARTTKGDRVWLSLLRVQNGGFKPFFQAKKVTHHICLSHVRPCATSRCCFWTLSLAGMQPWCMDLWPDDPVSFFHP